MMFWSMSDNKKSIMVKKPESLKGDLMDVDERHSNNDSDGETGKISNDKHWKP